MCGIAGFWDLKASTSAETLAAACRAMTDALVHRGPDMGDHWADGESGAALGFRRLAIIDLSPAGHQPMRSHDGRYMMTYNGEIYNYPELRRDLEGRGVSFNGHSDSEVMLELFARDGIEATLPRLVGMFAIALFDTKDRRLWLIRDRLGIKPVYWGVQDGRVFWASELKAIRAHPAFEARVDRDAVSAYLRALYVPAPATIYSDIEKLPPGGLVTIEADGTVARRRYWDMADVAAQPVEDMGDDEAVAAMEEVLSLAVSQRMIADVPLGALLSGGVDSSTVVALMAAASDRPVKTFTIGFDVPGFDEAAHAEAVAKHLGTDHTSLTLSPDAARDLIGNLPDWYDEPFADSSALPTYLVSRLAREQVTVALSGDGGDEGFFGYNRHRALAALDAKAGRVPASVRRAAAAGIGAVSAQNWDRIAKLVPEPKRPRQTGDKMHKLAAGLAASDRAARYAGVVGHWHDHPDRAAPDLPPVPDGLDAAAEAAYWDTVTYLPDDILTKVDRASMAVSLEARVPLLDHRVLELAWRLPTHLKIRGGQSKYLLRQVLYRHVPRGMVERPKSGFAIPLSDWLAGPLRDWAEDLLSERSLTETGLIAAAPVRAAWADHLAGRGNRQEDIWAILMLQSWARRWL